MTARGNGAGPGDVTDRVTSVRIDRLVLRNVGLDHRDTGQLAARIAAAIDDGGTPSRAAHARPPSLSSIASAVADRVRNEVLRAAPDPPARANQ